MALKLESTLLCCWTTASYTASRVVTADSTVPGSSVAPSSALLLAAALLPGTVARGCPRSPQSKSALCTVETKHLGRRQQHRGSTQRVAQQAKSACKVTLVLRAHGRFFLLWCAEQSARAACFLCKASHEVL